MTELTRLDAKSDVDEIVGIVQSDGALILENVLSPTQVDQTLSEIMPYVEATKPGADDFTGRHTRRTGALVARSATCRELIMNPTVRASAKQFLARSFNGTGNGREIFLPGCFPVLLCSGLDSHGIHFEIRRQTVEQSQPLIFR